MDASDTTIGDLMALLSVYPTGAKLSFVGPQRLRFVGLALKGPTVVECELSSSETTTSSASVLSTGAQSDSAAEEEEGVPAAVREWLARTHELEATPGEGYFARLAQRHGVSRQELREGVRVAWSGRRS